MELSQEQIRSEIRRLLCERSGVTYGWYVLDVYDDYAVAEGPNDQLMRVDYTKTAGTETTAGTVTLGTDLTAVTKVVQYMPIAEALGGRLIEAEGHAAGGVWNVLMIEPGVSGHNVVYTEAVLKAAVPLFEGVRALARPDSDHLTGKSIDPKNVVGWFENVHYAEAQGVVGQFHITADAEWLKLKLADAWGQGKTDLLGFSIVAGGRGRRAWQNGKMTTFCEAISQASFVDVVVRPAAGGRLLELVEAEAETGLYGHGHAHTNMVKETGVLEKLLTFIEAHHPTVYAKIDVDNVTEMQVMELLEAADVAPPTITTEPAAAEPASAPVAVAAPAAVNTAGVARMEAATAGLERRVAKMDLREALDSSALPAPVVAKLSTQLNARIDSGTLPEASEVVSLIEAERTVLNQLGSPGVVTGLGRRGIEVVGDPIEKAVAALDNVFTQKDGATSFKEAYGALTGDYKATLRLAECHNLPALRNFCEAQGFDLELHESLNTNAFDLVLGDVMNRQTLAQYALADLNDWRDICEVTPLNDFRTNHRTRFGGYGNLPQIGEDGIYNPLASPTNEEATYAPAKYGGTESITIEMIANDDVQAIRRIPINLGRAAAQSLYEFIFDLIRTNANIYDGSALFSVAHGNLHVDPWTNDAAQYFVHRNAMRVQADMDSGKRLGILPAHLFYAGELENAVYDSFTVGDNNEETFARRVRPIFHTVEYWDDPKSFYSVANPARCPTIEVGFWDGEEPSLWTQDQPTNGEMFTRDRRTYKIRHTYGATVLDYRGFQASIVP